MKTFPAIRCLTLFALACGAGQVRAQDSDAPEWSLRAAAQVDSAGIRVSHLFAQFSDELPDVVLAPPPAVGAASNFTRDQVAALLLEQFPEAAITNWTGAQKVRVTRRLRTMNEAEIKQSLTDELQRQFVKDRGELELRFTRPWAAVQVPDEPLEFRILDLPTSGVTANCIVRFELLCGEESVGSWQVPVKARIWRDVWVAGSSVRRGQLAADADLSTERRDLLGMRDAITDIDTGNPYLEMAETLRAGMPLTSRSFRLRPIIRRGQVLDAVIREGAMLLSVKVEALEDGLPGQTVRVRNLTSKREIRGEVKNEGTIQITL